MLSLIGIITTQRKNNVCLESPVYFCKASVHVFNISFTVKQVFSDMDFLGWYTTGDAPNESDIHVHKQICEINESPVFLKLNPFTRNSDLPVTMYESVIDLVNGEATMLFVELSYTLATEEAERIGVDHVARMATAGDASESSQGMLYLCFKWL